MPAKPEIRASVMPSEKNSCAGSRDRFTSGSTASDEGRGGRRGGGGGAVARRPGAASPQRGRGSARGGARPHAADEPVTTSADRLDVLGFGSLNRRARLRILLTALFKPLSKSTNVSAGQSRVRSSSRETTSPGSPRNARSILSGRSWTRKRLRVLAQFSSLGVHLEDAEANDASGHWMAHPHTGRARKLSTARRPERDGAKALKKQPFTE